MEDGASLAQPIPLTLRQQRGDTRALCAASLELQFGLNDERAVPSLQVRQPVEQIKHQAALARELGHEDHVDLAVLDEDVVSPALAPEAISSTRR